MIWKILTAQIREEIYDLLIRCLLFPEVQKECRKWAIGTKQLLFSDKHILKESKTRRKNLALVWNDYKKPYDMVLQSWIIDCFKMCKITGEVMKFMEHIMEKWKKTLNLNENPESNLPVRCTITITLCNSDDATETHT